jgi:hypothetical protein
MLNLAHQAIAVADSLNSKGYAHKAGEFGSAAGLDAHLLQSDRLSRRVRYSLDSFDDVSRPVQVIGSKHSESVHAVIALVPRVDVFMRSKGIHDQVFREFVNQFYGEQKLMSFAQAAKAGHWWGAVSNACKTLGFDRKKFAEEMRMSMEGDHA